MDVCKVDHRSSKVRINLEGPEATYYSRDWRHYANRTEPNQKVNKEETANEPNRKMPDRSRAQLDRRGDKPKPKQAAAGNTGKFGIAGCACPDVPEGTRLDRNDEIWTEKVGVPVD